MKRVRKNLKKKWLIFGIILLVVLLIGGLFLFQTNQQSKLLSFSNTRLEYIDKTYQELSQDLGNPQYLTRNTYQKWVGLELFDKDQELVDYSVKYYLTEDFVTNAEDVFVIEPMTYNYKTSEIEKMKFNKNSKVVAISVYLEHFFPNIKTKTVTIEQLQNKFGKYIKNVDDNEYFGGTYVYFNYQDYQLIFRATNGRVDMYGQVIITAKKTTYRTAKSSTEFMGQSELLFDEKNYAFIAVVSDTSNNKRLVLVRDDLIEKIILDQDLAKDIVAVVYNNKKIYVFERPEAEEAGALTISVIVKNGDIYSKRLTAALPYNYKIHEAVGDKLYMVNTEGELVACSLEKSNCDKITNKLNNVNVLNDKSYLYYTLLSDKKLYRYNLRTKTSQKINLQANISPVGIYNNKILVSAGSEWYTANLQDPALKTNAEVTLIKLNIPNMQNRDLYNPISYNEGFVYHDNENIYYYDTKENKLDINIENGIGGIQHLAGNYFYVSTSWGNAHDGEAEYASYIVNLKTKEIKEAYDTSKTDTPIYLAEYISVVQL